MGCRMKKVRQGLYLGHVVHRRLVPAQHKLRYCVFCCLFDCDQLAKTGSALRWFSYNKFNFFALYDRDFGDGGNIAEYAREVADQAGVGHDIKRFMMLCYPRILGYGFNPITVFYGLDQNDRIRLMIYEVRNTFGEKTTYVIPTDEMAYNILDQKAVADEVLVQKCEKKFFVSPFNKVEGQYQFHVTMPLDKLTFGVLLRSDNAGILAGILRAHFHGTRYELDDKNLLKAVVKTGWMTVKVMLGIHVEAAKLWMKGLRLKQRPKNPPKITYVKPSSHSN